MNIRKSLLLAGTILATCSSAWAGQAPGALSAPDVPITHHDRVYAAEQFSNTVSVTDPVDNKLLGVIRLGDPQPVNFSPLYKGQVLVHGMGYSPDHQTLAVVSIGSNSVTFIDTATNAVKHVTYVGRSPHEAFFTPDGKEVWVTVRGENYISVIDGKTFTEKTRITTPSGPGMQIFSPDGKYGYICSSFNPETDVVSVADHEIIAKVKQESPFCPNIAATPDGSQVWFTLKDVGKTQVFNARPPFNLIKTIDTGPITNHVNFAHTAKGTFAYVTIGGLNEVKVFRTDDFSQVATIPVGNLPHGAWPSGDGSRIYGTREWRRACGNRHRNQHRDRKHSDRTGAPGDRLCSQRRPESRRSPEPAASRCRRPGLASGAGGERREGRTGANQRFAVRSGTDPGVAGVGHRARAEAKIRARAGGSRGWRRLLATAGGLHDQSGRLGDRQCDRPDPANRPRSRNLGAALSGRRPRRCDDVRKGSTGANPIMVD
jgi:YVTN family beta-propeller protein